MNVPLLVVDTRGELTLFSSADKASGSLEALDVRAREFQLFDCAGVEYALSAESDDSPVVIGDPINSEANFDLVRNIALNFFEHLPRAGQASPPPVELDSPEDLCRALAPYAE